MRRFRGAQRFANVHRFFTIFREQCRGGVIILSFGLRRLDAALVLSLERE